MKRISLVLLSVASLLPAQAGAPAAVFSETPSPDAPEALSKQFGRFVGSWICKASSPQQDGSWKDNPGEPSWTWFYTLGGLAIQDVWLPAPDSPASATPGTNLRIYDPEQDAWNVVWTTTGQKAFDNFTARWVDDRIVMNGERPARGGRQAHLARITFHAIEDHSFLWKYEFSPPGDGENWTEVARLACRRRK